METINPQPSQTPQSQPAEAPGFMTILKASFQLFAKNWLKFVKLTLALAVPFLILGGILFFIGSAFLGKASAAPGIPGQNQPAVTAPAPEVANPDPDVTAPDIAPPAEMPAPENLPASESIPPTPYTVPADAGTLTPPTDAVNNADTGNPANEVAIPTNEPSNETANEDDGFSVVDPNNPNAGTKSSINVAGLGAIFGALGAVMIIVIVLLYIPIFLYILVATLAHIRLVVLISQGQESKTLDLIKWSLKKLGAYILLSLRIMLYVGWPVIAASILSVVIMILNIPALGFLSVLLIMAGSIYAIILGPRASFAQYVLAENDGTSKEALQGSIAAAKGHWWTIIGYSIIFGLVTGFASAVLNTIFSKINTIFGALMGMIISIAIGYIGVIFYFGLYHLCKMQNEGK